MNPESAAHFAGLRGDAAPATATTTATTTQVQTGLQQRTGYVAPQVEELGDDE
jgi:translocation protein SEC62